MSKRWTQKEYDYLQNYWGVHSVDTICKRLGRSQSAIMIKVNRLGLPPYLESGDYVSFNQVVMAVTGHNSHSYHLKSWVEERGFPLRTKRRGKCSYRIVYLDEFWEWAEKNRSFLDFSKMEPLALGWEPEWVQEQRSKDFKAFSLQRKDPWTLADDQRLIDLLKQHKYGYAELSARLNRSAGAIQRRCNDLGIKERPVKAPNTGKDVLWTQEMLDVLADGIRHGESYTAISVKVGKSEKAVRGKVYMTYYTESADKVRSMLQNGEWGYAAPIPTVNQGRHNGAYKAEILENLAALDAALRKRIRDLDDNPFWQHESCMHWNELQGCTFNEPDCDACPHYERIKPQYCARCGCTFYERIENRFCGPCRQARKRKAQAHWMRTQNTRRR